MRGKALYPFNPFFLIRITPAYAGKREGTKCVKINHKDHPRLCGEKKSTYLSLISDLGSPPPMRGKVNHIFAS